MFPSTGLERFNLDLQSVILSDLDTTNGCNKQVVKAENQHGPNISEKWRESSPLS